MKMSDEKKVQFLKSGLSVEIEGNLYKANFHKIDADICSCNLCNVDSNCTDKVNEICNMLGNSCFYDPYLELVECLDR